MPSNFKHVDFESEVFKLSLQLEIYNLLQGGYLTFMVLFI